MAIISNIGVIILAAGNSTRMQQTKQLLPWGNSTLLGKAIEAGLECNSKTVYVVVGAEAETIKAQFKNIDVHWVRNQEWEKGMGTSIASAAKYILNSTSNYEGILIMLCDQPLIDAKYLNGMIAVFESSNKGIVATAYKHSKGVPVLFHKKYLNELAKFEGEIGARVMISANDQDVITVIPNGKEKDLDTFKEYQQELKKI